MICITCKMSPPLCASAYLFWFNTTLLSNKILPGCIFSSIVGLLKEQVYRSSQCTGFYFDYERGICSLPSTHLKENLSRIRFLLLVKLRNMVRNVLAYLISEIYRAVQPLALVEAGLLFQWMEI